jgi:hypothetical protein
MPRVLSTGARCALRSMEYSGIGGRRRFEEY